MDGKLDDLNLKVETLNMQIEKSNEFINSIKAELSELKIRPQSYAASLGTIAKGKVFYPSANDNGMGIRVRGIQENESKSPDERLHADMNSIEEILCYLKVEDKRLCKVTRIGKYNPEKGPRTILINLESPISKELVLKSAFRFKNFSRRVFISDELTPEQLKIENECLRKRRLLIDNHMFPNTDVRVRNLVVEIKQGDKWVEYKDILIENDFAGASSTTKNKNLIL